MAGTGRDLPPLGLALAALVVAAGSWTCGPSSAPAYPAGAPAAAGDERSSPWVAAVPDDPPRAATPAAHLTPDWDLAAFVEEGRPGLRLPLWDPSGRALEGFHSALRRAEAGDGKARVLFWGASHVAAGWTTAVVRDALQARFGDGGHGFVLPVKPWRSYRHIGVDIESDWRRWTAARVRAGDVEPDAYGLAGVFVEGTHGGGYGQVLRTAGPADLFEVWFLRQPGGGAFDVVAGDRRLRRVSTDGDRFAPGFEAFKVDAQGAPLRVRLVGDGPVRLFGTVLERDAPGVVVDTLGVNGARARYQLLWDDGVFRAQLARRAPDLVVLAYGTNESGDDQPLALYERQLRDVVGRIQEVAPTASCVLIGPSDRPARDPALGELVDRPRTGELVEIQRVVAVESGCAFFDLVAFSGGPLSIAAWAALDPPFAAPDLVHFTRLGYERLGEVLIAALLDGYDPPTDP